MKSKDERTAYHREWRAKNREKDRVLNAASRKRWKKKHPTKHAAANLRSYYKHRAEILARRKVEYDSNKEKHREAQREWRRNNLEHARLRDFKHHLRSEFNLTLEQFEAMFEAQGQCCGICRKPRAAMRKLCVDHCHATLKVRGILCDNCNFGIAQFRDNPMFLHYAIEYLQRHG
jgi:hypothetical protein